MLATPGTKIPEVFGYSPPAARAAVGEGGMFPQTDGLFMTIGTVVHPGHHRFTAPGIGTVMGIALVSAGAVGNLFKTFPVAPGAKLPVEVPAMFAMIAKPRQGGDVAKTVLPVAAPGADRHPFSYWLFAFAA